MSAPRSSPRRWWLVERDDRIDLHAHGGYLSGVVASVSLDWPTPNQVAEARANAAWLLALANGDTKS